MTKDEAEAYWKADLEKHCSPPMIEELYKRAGGPVYIYESDELDMGVADWAVSQEDNYWMTTFKTKAEAEAFVEAMGWPILEE